MGYAIHHNLAKQIFETRRKTNDFKPWKTDTHITEESDGTFVFSYAQYEWKYDEKKRVHVKQQLLKRTPLVSVSPSNVLTLLATEEHAWPSIHHMTIRNRLQDITGFHVYSDTDLHGNKETPIRVRGKRYDNGWVNHDWCASGSMPYKAGTQFQLHVPGSVVDCINPPQDMKITVKTSAVQQVKADTAVIRKLAKVMVRVGFDEHIEKRVDMYSTIPPKAKALSEVDYRNPTSEDAMAVLVAGLRMANRPDETIWDSKTGKYTTRPRDVRVQILRERVLENGMKALRQHIYETTGGYEMTPV